VGRWTNGYVAEIVPEDIWKGARYRKARERYSTWDVDELTEVDGV
jgi:hypothetical protein